MSCPVDWKNSFPEGDRYFETPNGILYCGDSCTILQSFPNDVIDLIITSPPYNLGFDYKSYSDQKDYNEYIEWLTDVFLICYNKLIPGGRLCLNIGDQKNGRIPTHAHMINNLTQSGYLLYSTIIWDKQQTRRRTTWGSFNSPSSPSYPSPFEYVLVFAKNSYKLQHKGKSDLTKEEFVQWAYGLWRFSPESKMKKWGHPSVFPEELPKRCIKMNSYLGDLILDPFAGVGTTCIVAEKLSRKWVGIEIEEEYCETAKNRLIADGQNSSVDSSFPKYTKKVDLEEK